MQYTSDSHPVESINIMIVITPYILFDRNIKGGLKTIVHYISYISFDIPYMFLANDLTDK